MLRVVHLLDTPDPVGAFAEATRTGALLALRTSGTSSVPRTVVRTPASWVHSFPHVSDLLGVDGTSRVWVPGPTSASMNLFGTLHARWAGATVVDDPRAATHAHLTPTALHRLLHDDAAALAGVHVVTAGDRLARATYDAAQAAGVRLSHYYGAAELSFVAWGANAEELRPFPGVEVAARDRELWVRSPYVCEGYLEAGHTLRRDGDGWTTVGDRGAVEGGPTDGVVRVHGRGGGITTGGATVLVADLEAVLGRKARGEVVVVGVPHPGLGQLVAAACTVAEDVPRLRELARASLSPAQRPRLWQHLPSLPTTSTGKVDRDAVAATLAARRGVVA